MLQKTIAILIILVSLVSCTPHKQSGNQILFDGITFTVISEGLISFELENKDSISFKKDGTFKLFEIEKSTTQLVIKTSKQKFIYTCSESPLLERISIEFKKNNSTILSAR